MGIIAEAARAATRRLVAAMRFIAGAIVLAAMAAVVLVPLYLLDGGSSPSNSKTPMVRQGQWENDYDYDTGGE